MNLRERVARLISSVKYGMDAPSKLEYLQQLKEELSTADYALLSEFLPGIIDLLTDRFSPVRKFITEVIGEIGTKHVEFLPEIVPVVINVLKDSTPAVARQAVTCGIDLFRSTFTKVAIQGLYSSKMDDLLESSWVWMLKLRENIYSIAFQPGSGGVRLLALKFVEATILLYTLDPNGSPEPPSHQEFEGKLSEFNISWLRGGHPLLNVGDLSIEASQSLGLLLDQLRFPLVKSLNNLVVIVLIKSLSTIALRRPSFYGRILPVILGLDHSHSGIKGVLIGADNTLKKAFISLLQCTHPSATPWRDRLIGALRDKAGGLAEEGIHQFHKIDASMEAGRDDLPITKEEKPSIKSSDAVQVSGRKRYSVQDLDYVDEEDDNMPGKRVRSISTVSEDSTPSNVDSEHVKQLVAMFGALVAQGEKAVGSLEILISSISTDLLADVVMANMKYLPANLPKLEGDEEDLAKYPLSFLANFLSVPGSFPQIASLLDAQGSASDDIVKPRGKEGSRVETVLDSDMSHVSSDNESEKTAGPTDVPVSSDIEATSEISHNVAPPEVHDLGNLESQIPGLDSSPHTNGLTGQLPVPDLLPSISTEKSEEHSSKNTNTESNSLISSTATSYQLILPKMTAPVISLSDEQRDNLQKLAFMRIIEAHKQASVAGGSHVRFSLLSYLGIELPLDLEPWKLLLDYILSDYLNHEGHELTLRVLYRLFGEAEVERDFFSSTTASSVYEMFLLTVAESVRDSFPASDKSLSRLLVEVPFLPKAALKLLESLCSPRNGDKYDKELLNGDRVTQGLSAVWSLILLRPPMRDVCLKIVLQSAVHHSEEVRMKAIRLVANKLYPLPSITQNIEDFAKESLLSVIDSGPGGTQCTDETDAERSTSDAQKDFNLDKPINELPSVSSTSKDISSESSATQSIFFEAQRHMSLYFALCTKKHSLFRQIFVIYKSTSKVVKQAIDRHIPILIRTIGSSSELLEIISDPPIGSEDLLKQVLHTLTDRTIPSPELVFTIKKLYDSNLKDVDILIPILSFLPKEEISRIFPPLVNLQPDKFQAALTAVLQGSSHSGAVLSPEEVLIAIHGIDPDRDGIPLKKVTDACNICFEQRQIFTQQVIAKVLNQLVEQTPLPLLFMRTVLQAIGAFPALVDFIMEILSRLVSKQIWKYPKLWVGFLKCAQLTKPQSFSVLLQLPPAQLENALNRIAALKAPLISHANQPHVRSLLPRSVLAVLGISPDSQTSSQAQTTQAPEGDTSNSDKEVVMEKTKESSSAS